MLVIQLILEPFIINFISNGKRRNYIVKLYLFSISNLNYATKLVSKNINAATINLFARDYTYHIQTKARE